MSPLSSNTLFHFTSRRGHLLRILTEEFRPHYAFEDFGNFFGSLAGDRDAAVGIPMVCFCDIPLSQTAAHMNTYGRYALGLTKPWGQRLGVSPVLYTYPGAATIVAVINLHIQIEALRGTMDDGAAFNPYTERFMCFVKPYVGDLTRGGLVATEVRFYDEREWRYVPEGPWVALKRAEFADAASVSAANADVAARYRLSFDPGDVRYIVVADEREIGPMIADVRRIKSRKYSSEAIDILCTRIVSAQQIAEDF